MYGHLVGPSLTPAFTLRVLVAVRVHVHGHYIHSRLRASDHDSSPGFRLYVNNTGHVQHQLLTPAVSACNENQQPAHGAYAGAATGANDAAFQTESEDVLNPFNTFLNFDSTEYIYGLSGFQSSLPVLGGPSGVRTSARSVLYHKKEVINQCEL